MTSGRRSKSKLPPDVTQTTVLPADLVRQFRQHIDRQRACRFQHDAFDVQHLQHRDADAVFGGQQHLIGADPVQLRKGCRADPRHGGAIDKAVDARQR